MDINGEDTNQPCGTVTARPPLHRNKDKDGINVADVKHQSNSSILRNRTKAHLGGGDDSCYNKPERSPGDKADHIINSDEEEEADNSTVHTHKGFSSSDDEQCSHSETKNGPEPEIKIESHSTTDKSSVYDSKTYQSHVSSFDRSTILDPKTEKSQKTEEGPVSKKKALTRGCYIGGALFAVFIAVLVGIHVYLQPTSFQDSNLLQVFSHEMEKVQSSFPGQRHELWKRTNIHLKRHLNLTNPLEPVSLILTSGQGAVKTLSCLAQSLATAFSNALNSSALDIDGISKKEQDSDQVKLEVDEKLQKAFEGGARAAVIHNFEEFPPGSTLIFYRYCDHENAAYKKVFLVFTVVLPVTEIGSKPSLSDIEQSVQEHLQKRFVSTVRTATFNEMDVDKLSGLWSRISHLILPVSADQKIEQSGCATSA